MVTPIIADRFFIVASEKTRKGGMATVYKALDTQQDGKAVAVKLFESVNLQDHFLKESFLRESEALTSLKHPNIVALVSSGFDVVSERHYIVLPWYEDTLSNYASRTRGIEWNSFAEAFVKPLLEGLALAHTRDVIHRDIKPSNILVSPEEVPCLADFGIAKFVDSLRFGVTMQEFVSRPFAPPEFGTMPSSPRGDLYSLGITLLYCLAPTGQDLNARNIQEAFQASGLPAPAQSFLSRLSAHNPDERPYNAEVALGELNRLLRDIPRDTSTLPRYSLWITSRAEENARYLLRCRDRSELQAVITQDLQAGLTSIRIKDEAQVEAGVAAPADRGETYSLLGQDLSYHVALRKNTRDALAILSVNKPPASLLNRLRETHMPVEAAFTFQDPLHLRQAQQQLDALIGQMAEFMGEQIVRERKAEEENLFRKWGNILRAKKDAERSREDPLAYSSCQSVRGGASVHFRLETQVDENAAQGIVGQSRRVVGRDKKDKIEVIGVVDDIVGNELIMYVQRGNPALLPNRGQLLIDTTPSMTALRRQERALEAVITGSCARSDLKNLLIHPELASPPMVAVELASLDLLQPDLDAPKQAALNAALHAPDIIAVQGPPGTGKTTWIAELVCQQLRRSPRSKVLLSGQTHIAVDNALEGIEELAAKSFPSKPLKIIRVGPTRKISAEAERFRIPDQMQAWSQSVRQSSDSWLNAWALSEGISEDRLALGAKLQALEASGRTVDEKRSERLSLQEKITQISSLQRRLEVLAGEVFDQAATIETTLAATGTTVDWLMSASTVFQEASSAYIDLGLRLADGINGAISACGSLSSGGLEDEIAMAAYEEEDAMQTVKQLRNEIAIALGDEVLLEVPISELREAVERSMQATAQQMERLKTLQTLQTEWLQRFGSGPDFEEALISQADIVAGTCIGVASQKLEDLTFDLVVIDEASKATPTEALAAMTLGRKWVLVGDQKQLPPFADDALKQRGLLEKYDLDTEDLRHTLFDRMVAGLPDDCRPRLTVQHRMIQEIGDLISECFYGGDLKTGRTDSALPALARTLKKPVTWYTTSRL